MADRSRCLCQPLGMQPILAIDSRRHKALRSLCRDCCDRCKIAASLPGILVGIAELSVVTRFAPRGVECCDRCRSWLHCLLHRQRGKALRVYLDDERPAPPGWVRAYWPDDVIALLKTGAVRELSLDHDLGDDARGTGYDVVLWIEEAVMLRKFLPPVIHVHSANSSARQKMLAGVAAIQRLARLKP